MRGVLEIDLPTISENIKKLKGCVKKDTSYIAVIKANGYGLGLERMADFLKDHVDAYAVANIMEAERIKKVYDKIPILILSPVLPIEMPKMVDMDVIPFISSKLEVEMINEISKAQSKTTSICVVVDTGMGREGVWHEDLDLFFENMEEYRNIKIHGMATHLSSITSDDECTRRQLDIFSQAVLRFGKEGMMIHSTSGYGVDKYNLDVCNAVRIGAVQYGIAPSDYSEILQKIDLKPAVQLKAFISLIKRVPDKVKIGYDQTLQLSRETHVALVTVGYADGIPVSLSNRGQVLIQGQRCNIIGRISMDQVIVDVTDLSNVKVNDEVVFFGKQGNNEITLTEYSNISGLTIRACLCDISDRVSRVYKEY